MQRKLIQFGATLLENTGINISEERNSDDVYKFVIIFGMFALAHLSASMVSLTNTDDFYTCVIPFPYIAGATIMLSGIYFMYHYKSLIGELFRQMDRNFYTYPDEHLITFEYPWYLKENNITVMLTLTKYASFSVLVVVCIPILAELMWFGRIKTVLYPMWTPWKLDGLTVELGMFLFQALQGFCGLWINYVTMVFLLIVVIEFSRQYQRLKAAVSTLESRTWEGVLVDGGEFDRTLRDNIIHCVRHHQVLHKNFYLFRIWFSILFSIELAVSSVTFTFTLYVVMNAPSMGQILNYCSVVCLIWAGLLIRCLISEVFFHQNDNLSFTLLWNAPWNKTSKENGKLLVMFHSSTCRPLRLFGLSIFEATRVTFAKLVRITYSFLNVLNKSR